MDLNEFHDHILPEAEQALPDADGRRTMRALYRSAQAIGLFPASYGSFRRLVLKLRPEYGRQLNMPTVEDLLFRLDTGRWPVRVKAFARRRAKEEAQLRQQIRADYQAKYKEYNAASLPDLCAKMAQAIRQEDEATRARILQYQNGWPIDDVPDA